MIKVFISGPMSGIEDFNKPEFLRAERLLRRAGYSVFNPAWLDLDEAWSTEEIAAIDMAALTNCDAIYQLDDWEKSKGAVAEFNTAKWLGLDILTEADVRYKIKINESTSSKLAFTEYLEGGPKPRTEHRFW